jgi:hypothetical protein
MDLSTVIAFDAPVSHLQNPKMDAREGSETKGHTEEPVGMNFLV